MNRIIPHHRASTFSSTTNLSTPPSTAILYPVIFSMVTTSVSIPRFLLPRANYLLRPRTRLLPPTSNPHSALVRHASNSQPSSSKPLVLEKPAKFNPPSHGARLPRKKPRNYGSAPTEQQKHEMKTKKYPNMMPPEGSFMHWFLTNRWLHTWISLVCFPRSVVSVQHFLPSHSNSGARNASELHGIRLRLQKEKLIMNLRALYLVSHSLHSP